ncbi:hypothetical protein AZE42_11216 [Rhizopogon vesiculosus]|uniref:Uncharacterized protein n=1 Tax=Rhizopogon vesiculosus TaxID=180088 RepID=A0A1J8Q2T8_9AGAM|nr:hypothetical protein AZE42_11216 [Rhizopogon vesiculosus]
MLSMDTTGTEDWFTLDVPSVAHESAQPVSLYIPASPSPLKQLVPDRNQCASDPVVQAAVAQLSAGPSDHHNGRFELPHNCLVGLSEALHSVIDTGCNLLLSSSQTVLAEFQ